MLQGRGSVYILEEEGQPGAMVVLSWWKWVSYQGHTYQQN